MLALFCMRLAAGMSGAMLLLNPTQINPRFFRTHFLTVLGLTTGATLLLVSQMTLWLALLLAGSMGLAFLGSLVWFLHGAPGGRGLMPITAICLIGVLAALEWSTAAGRDASQRVVWILLNDLASAWLLGTVTSAMLMGHSYLIAPAMSLRPLTRLLAALASALFLRAALAGYGLWSWTREHSLGNLNDVTVLLPVRWGITFVGPAILCWMVWQSAKIRSTQSATGILYVAVVFCFLGELTGQVIDGITGSCL